VTWHNEWARNGTRKRIITQINPENPSWILPISKLWLTSKDWSIGQLAIEGGIEPESLLLKR